MNPETINKTKTQGLKRNVKNFEEYFNEKGQGNAKINWYPGCGAICFPNFLMFLKENYRYKWLFTDKCDFDWNSRLPSFKLMIQNTFISVQNNEVWIPSSRIDTLVLSFHPGLKTPEEIMESGILYLANPRRFIFNVSDGAKYDWKFPIDDSYIEYFPGFKFSHLLTNESWGCQFYAIYDRINK